MGKGHEADGFAAYAVVPFMGADVPLVQTFVVHSILSFMLAKLHRQKYFASCAMCDQSTDESDEALLKLRVLDNGVIDMQTSYEIAFLLAQDDAMNFRLELLGYEDINLQAIYHTQSKTSNSNFSKKRFFQKQNPLQNAFHNKHPKQNGGGGRAGEGEG